jgi:OOP family OmpA-OmpF porin
MNHIKTPKPSISRACILKLCSAISALLLIQGLFTSSLAQAQSASPQSVSGSANNTGVFELGDAFVAPGSVDKQQTRLIFYRTSNSSFKGGASIYFDGMYHATLGRSSYSVLCVNPSVAVNLGVKPVWAGRQVKDNYDSTNAVELQGGRNQYVRVVEERLIKVLQPVSEAEALAELAGTREQIHTLSRVTSAQVCRSLFAETPKPSEPVQTITLAADALFDFAGSDRKALGVQGRVALDNLIANVQANYTSINQLDVLGHTDPIGSDQQNDRLSIERAQTVKSYLQQNGLQSTRITAQGRGASVLVVNTCGRAATAADIACNSPNRRVTVEIRGTRR